MPDQIPSRSRDFIGRVWEFVRIWRYGHREQVLAAVGLLLLAAPQLLKLVPDLPTPPGWLTLTLSVAGAGCLAWCVRVIWRQTVPPLAAPAAAKPSAIKGAGSFGPQDGELFLRLGRNRELARLHGWALDDQVPLVVLLGESGVGKTSLVRSGLPEHLRSVEVPVIYWEALPGEPEKGLLHAVRSQWPEGEKAPESLAELVGSEGTPRAVLVIDQLEQLSPAKHPEIFALLREAICAEPPYRATWVVAFRREYLPVWQDFELDELPAAARRRVEKLSLKRFSAEEAEKVLAVLVAESGLAIEQRVLTELLDGITEDGSVSPVDVGISLLILSGFAGSEGGRSVFSVDDFRTAGGQEGLLTTYLERLLEAYSEGERQEIFRALLRLVDLESDQRIAEGVSLEEITGAAEPVRPARLADCLEGLASPRARILELLPGADGSARFRLTHERLIPALRRLTGRLLAEADQAGRVLERWYRVWARERRGRYLLSGKEFRQVWRNRQQLRWGRDAAGKRDFLDRSWWRQNLVRALILMGVIVFIVFLSVGWQRYQKELERNTLQSWGLPRDLVERQRQLETITLPDTVNRVGWLHDGLKTLNARGAGITSLKGLPASLTSLDLSGTPITSLEGLPASLTSLDLSGTPIMSLEGLPASLTSLDLSWAPSTILGFPGFTTFSLRGPQIKSLEGLPASLTSLDLRLTWITSTERLPSSLTSLDLSGAWRMSFQGLPASLTSLNLSETQITSLEGLPASLTSLDLSGARLQSLTGLPASLTSLNLSGTRLTVLEPGDRPLTSLEGLPASLTSLDLSRTGVTSLEGLPASLTSLDLGGTKIWSLEGLPASLTCLDLGGTQIWSLEGLPASLTSLDLSETWITSLEGLPASLTSLDLSRTQITSLEGLPASLTSLDLSRTQITSLEGLPASLTSLDLSRTRITSLEGLPTSLTSLDLSGTKIKSLEGLPASLTSLDLSYTQITSLEGLPASLTSLDLSYTQITSLEGLPNGLEKLTVRTGQLQSLEGLPASVRELHFVVDPRI